MGRIESTLYFILSQVWRLSLCEECLDLLGVSSILELSLLAQTTHLTQQLGV